MMSTISELIKSHHIQLSLVVGSSIIAMALASKWLLPEPLSYLTQAFPPFLGVLYESFYKKYPGSKYSRVRYWNTGIVLATVLVILINLR
jgi:hypothetical protein